MPLPDGTNDEKEDVSPPLEWKSSEDIKNAELYQMHGSPPCCKIRQFLFYYKVPFTTINKKDKGSYKKVPVFKASGRQINDSYVIFKNLVPVLCGESFNEEWQDKITYGLQLSIEADAFQTPSDMKKLMVGAFGVPSCIACCIAPSFGRKMSKGIREKNPNLPKSVDIGKEFAAALAGKKFFGGEEPGQVDIAYYGTLIVFQSNGTITAKEHLDNSGLNDWWNNMSKVMPNAMVPSKAPPTKASE